MSDRALICVFAKPPVPGAAKTRLASEIGPTRAAAVAGAFLRDTWHAVSALRWARSILSTTGGVAEDFGLPGRPSLWLQGEGDLGQRIERIVRRGLGAADLVIAIGADTPGLPLHFLEEAYGDLTTSDAVLGPSDDGGFYLIGLRRCPPGVFRDLPWSSPRTFAAVKDRLQSLGMSVAVLGRWFDIDRPEDLDRLRGLIERGDVSAPHTAGVLGISPPDRTQCP